MLTKWACPTIISEKQQKMKAPKVLLPRFTVYPAVELSYNIYSFQSLQGQGPLVLYKRSVPRWEIDEIHPKKQSLLCIQNEELPNNPYEHTQVERVSFPDCSTHRLHGQESVWSLRYSQKWKTDFNPINYQLSIISDSRYQNDCEEQG